MSNCLISTYKIIELLKSPNLLNFVNSNNNNNIPDFDANNSDSDSDSDSENLFSIDIDVEHDFYEHFYM